jgi:hypothetical protein
MKTSKSSGVVSGLFRFRTGTQPEEIEKYFENVLDDPGIISLHIRKVSKTQYGVQFVYDINKHEDGLVSSYKDFRKKAVDALYKHFGKKLQSWDFAETHTQLK